MAAAAEERKVAKYMALGRSHSFTAVAIETLGAIGPKSLTFIRDLGYRMKQRTDKDRTLRVLAHRKYRRPRSRPHLIDHIFGARITLILLFASLFY